MHVETKDKISAVVSRLKPDSKRVYYGLILAEKSVVGLIKNDPSITIIPSGKFSFAFNACMSDIQIILNYIITNDERLQDTSPVFEAICLPGMTEAFKLHIFIFIEEDSNMRFVYVCEENS